MGGGAINDNIYLFSDVFSPAIGGAVPGAGVAPVAGFYSASSQAQMNYLLAPLLAPGVAPGFSLTTPSTFAVGAPAVPFPFWEAARSPIGPGTLQLVGALNFQLTAGSEIYMPGSLIVDANDPSVYASEVPEPASFAMLGGGLLALGYFRRRSRLR